MLAIGDLGDLGIVTAAASLPFLIVALPGGAISDRVGRREVMLVADSRAPRSRRQRGAAAHGRGRDLDARRADGALRNGRRVLRAGDERLIPQTVAEHRVQDANALIGLTMNVGMIVGPAIAGVLLALAGPGEAIAIDSATFVASAIFLARLRPAEIAARRPGRGEPMLDSVREGWRIVARQRLDPPGLCGLVSYHLFVLPSVFVLGPAIAQEDLSGATSWAAISRASASAPYWATSSRCGSSPRARWSPRSAR